MATKTSMQIYMFFILALGCLGERVEIHPTHVRVSADPTNVTITCRSSTPITGCQFSWWGRVYGVPTTSPVMDLSMGAESAANPAHLIRRYGYSWQPLLGYSYSGRGLSHGECGLRMEVKDEKTWLVSCRVKTAGGWVYNWTDLYAFSLYGSLRHTLEPRRELVVVEGGQGGIFLKTDEPLEWCRFNLPGERWLGFHEGPASSDSNGRYLYQGAGLSNGECGLALGNVTEEDNGVVTSTIYQSSSSTASGENRLTPLVVARPPTPPTLNLWKTGTNFTATCRVQLSRPAPQITWSLGNQVIQQDVSPDTEGESWWWPWTAASWSHTIMVTIQPSDLGKELKCSVSHVALRQPLEAVEVTHSTDGIPSTGHSNNDIGPASNGVTREGASRAWDGPLDT